MAISKQEESGFLAKMKERAANKPSAPLAIVPADAAPETPLAKPKKPAAIIERTMSFKLADADYDAIDEVIFKRKRAGEKGLTNKDAGREMVALWLEKHGAKPFDYGQ